MTDSIHSEADNPRTGEIVWDRTNIIESYPGVTLPLTFSFIQHAYSRVYPSFLRSIGVPQRFLQSYQPVFDSLLGHLAGRVYYKAESWYKLIRVLPLYRFNKEFFEAMWNPVRAWGVTSGREPLGAPRRWWVGACFVVRLATARWHIARFKAKFARDLVKYRSRDTKPLTNAELAELYRSLEVHFFSSWAVPIMNDFRVMVYHGLLRKLLLLLTSAPTDALAAGLLGSSRLASYSNSALAALTQLVNEVRAQPQLVEALRSAGPGSALRSLLDSNVAPRLRQYVESYGDRHPSELKLESTTIREQPELLAALIQQHLHSPAAKTVPGVVKQPPRRLLLEYKGTHHWFTFTLLALAIRLAARATRRALIDREELRLNRSLAFGLARHMFFEFGCRMQAEGQLANPRDVFYLTRDEILHWAVSGECVGQDEVRHRVAQYDDYRALPEPPRRLRTTGDDLAHWISEVPSTDSAGRLWHGTPASAGRVQAPAIVMPEFGADIDVRGKVLVTLQTDPGGTVIFPLLAGVVTERGGRLSHAAIVSRELGIPSVLGVADATLNIRNGDIIEVDGTAGTVAIMP